MRPSLTLIIIILAVLFSLAAGLVLGGGPGTWLRRDPPASGNPNADIPVAPPTPTSPTLQPLSQAVATTALNAPIPVTVTATATVALTATPRPTATPVPTDTPLPVATVVPTEATTNTPDGVAAEVLLVADTSVRVRSAPANDSTVIGMLNAGQSASVIGRTADWAWVFVVLNANASEGWVTADAEFVSLEGDLDSVPLVQ